VCEKSQDNNGETFFRREKKEENLKKGRIGEKHGGTER
jgi:hypothetical protein